MGTNISLDGTDSRKIEPSEFPYSPETLFGLVEAKRNNLRLFRNALIESIGLGERVNVNRG